MDNITNIEVSNFIILIELSYTTTQPSNKINIKKLL